MKRRSYILTLTLIWGIATSYSQGVAWSLFPTGFAVSRSATATLTSSVGATFVGFSRVGSASISSGSLSGRIVAVTGVKESNSLLPREYTLYQNYPNPFNPSTTVRYDLPKATFVALNVFDVLGRHVSTIVNEEKPAGAYQVNVYTPNLPSGVYFYRIHAGDFVKTKKFILLK